MLDAAGLPPRADLPGTSLLPLVEQGAAAAAPWREGVLVEHHRGDDLDWNSHAWREAQWKVVRHGSGRVELYDLYADPWETRNVASHPQHEAQGHRLLNRLERQVLER